MKRTALLLLILLCLSLLSGCGAVIPSANAPASAETAGEIVLKGSTAESTAGGVKIAGCTVTLTAAGSYSLTGTLDEGQIIVDTGEDAGKVNLILNNASVTCTTGPALWVKQAKKLDLVIGEGSENTLISGIPGREPDPEASGAAVKADDDIDIEGSTGTLNIFGYLNSGLTCKNDVEIKCGDCAVNITAVNNGIKGEESVTVSAGKLSIRAGHDGIKSTDADKPGKGFVLIEGGTVCITADTDPFDVKGELLVNGGTVLALGKSKTLKSFSPESRQKFSALEQDFPNGARVTAAGLTVISEHRGNVILVSDAGDLRVTVE